jgi:hypothetical protein
VIIFDNQLHPNVKQASAMRAKVGMPSESSVQKFYNTFLPHVICPSMDDLSRQYRNHSFHFKCNQQDTVDHLNCNLAYPTVPIKPAL